MGQLQVTATFPAIAPSDREEFTALAASALEIARGEPDVLQYDWFTGADGATCIVRETYASSEALLEHVGSVGALLGRLMELGGGFQVDVFADPSPELLAATAALAPNV